MAAMRLKPVWSPARQAVNAWIDDYAPSMGAALSYYTLFSIAPLLLIVTALAGMVFGDAAARGEIFGQLRGLMGDEGAAAVEKLVQSADRPEGGVVATVTGVLVLLSALGKLWGPAFRGWESLAHALDILASFVIVTVLFAMIYKIIPRVRIRWRDVWIGAAVTSALFAVGKFLIGLYIGKSSIASAFGAAGSLAVMMVWVYYSAQIFLLGAASPREAPPARSRLQRRPVLSLGVAAALGVAAGVLDNLRRRRAG